jgi:hypothetical protein
MSVKLLVELTLSLPVSLVGDHSLIFSEEHPYFFFQLDHLFISLLQLGLFVLALDIL